MQKVAMAGEDHGGPALICGGDDFFVADRAAGLDGGGGSGVEAGEQSIGEWEHGVTGDDAAVERQASLFGFPHSETTGIDARHLTGTDTEGAVAFGEYDGVRLDVFAHAPGKTHGFNFVGGRWALGDDFLFDRIEAEGHRIGIHHQQTTRS